MQSQRDPLEFAVLGRGGGIIDNLPGHRWTDLRCRGMKFDRYLAIDAVLVVDASKIRTRFPVGAPRADVSLRRARERCVASKDLLEPLFLHHLEDFAQRDDQ